jgi:hypothetical protein
VVDIVEQTLDIELKNPVIFPTLPIKPWGPSKAFSDSRPKGDSKITFVQFGSHSPLLATVVPDGQFG